MKKHIVQAIGILVLFFFLGSPCIADEGFITLNTISCSNLTYDEQLGKIFVVSLNSGNTSIISVLDPISLTNDNSFQVDGAVQEVVVIDNGTSLLAVAQEIDGVLDTHDGKLVEIDYFTGNILSELEFFEYLPFTMAVDPTENYVYIFAGLLQDPPPKVFKIALSNFQIIDDISFGQNTFGIGISSDGSEIFIDTYNVFPSVPDHYEPGMGVINTFDMSVNDIILLPSAANDLNMSRNKLEIFISAQRYDELPESAGLYIFDTLSNAIVKKKNFFIDSSEVTPLCVTQCVEYDSLFIALYPNSEDTINIIQYYITDDVYVVHAVNTAVSSKKLGHLALVPLTEGYRLFALEQASPFVHYIDIFE